jgi:hypothetical protein
MPLHYPNLGVEGIRHVAYLAVDQDNHPVIVHVTLEAQDQYGSVKTMDKGSQKYDAGQVDRATHPPSVEVKTTDFK